MAIGFEDAKRIAEAEVPAGCALIESLTRALPYGWYFMYQSARYLQTGDIREMLMGPGGFVVDKETGRVCRFGSGYPVEKWLEMYEYGLRYESYDLVITDVYDFDRASRLLLGLGLTFVVPATAHGRLWRIPQPYSLAQIRSILTRLPCTFRDVRGLYFRYGVLREIDASRSFAYELLEHDPRRA